MRGRWTFVGWMMVACADGSTVTETHEPEGVSPADSAVDTKDAASGIVPDAGMASTKFDASSAAREAGVVDAGIDATSVDGLQDAASTSDGSVDEPALSDDLALTRLLALLESCAIVGPGRHVEPPVRDGFDRCWRACELKASCDAIRRVRCGGERDIDLDACRGECTTLPFDDGFPCGSRPTRYAYVCDGLIDCPNDADERDCRAFVCASGESPTNALACDGRRDCADGSDERGCAPYCASQ